MIREISLNESKNFHIYEYNEYLYNKGIKADTCIILDNLECYYNKEKQIIYVDCFQSFYKNDEELEETGEITKEMLEELVNYLGWKKWSINLYYYDYEEAMIVLIHKTNNYHKNNTIQGDK